MGLCSFTQWLVALQCILWFGHPLIWGQYRPENMGHWAWPAQTKDEKARRIVSKHDCVRNLTYCKDFSLYSYWYMAPLQNFVKERTQTVLKRTLGGKWGIVRSLMQKSRKEMMVVLTSLEREEVVIVCFWIFLKITANNVSQWFALQCE